MRLPDTLSAHASGVCQATRQERPGACERKFPDDHQPEALAAAVQDIVRHGHVMRNHFGLSSYGALQILLSFFFRKSLNRITQHGPFHGSAMRSEKSFHSNRIG